MAKKKAYISNKEFLEEIIKSKEQDELTPRTGELFLKLAKRIAATKFYYVVEADKYTCMSGGLEDCVRYWRTFNPEKSNNPFSFFTMTIINGMKREFNKLYPVRAANILRLNEDSNFYDF
jgi:hypothetical protein